MDKKLGRGILLFIFCLFMTGFAGFLSVMFYIYSDLLFGSIFAVLAALFVWLGVESVRSGMKNKSRDSAGEEE